MILNIKTSMIFTGFFGLIGLLGYNGMRGSIDTKRVWYLIPLFIPFLIPEANLYTSPMLVSTPDQPPPLFMWIHSRRVYLSKQVYVDS